MLDIVKHLTIFRNYEIIITEKMKGRKNMKYYNCCVCGKGYIGYGNNPYPLTKENETEKRCCDECNSKYVIPARIFGYNGYKPLIIKQKMEKCV